MKNLNCPVCDENGLDESCSHCGFEIVRHYWGMTDNEAQLVDQKRIEAAKQEWLSKKAPDSGGWNNYSHELKYKVEARHTLFGKHEPELLLHIVTPVSPPLQLPATVLVGREERLPTSPADGVELCRWPVSIVGSAGALYTAPLSLLRGKSWFLRLFMSKETDAKRIRLLHGSASEMRID